jgi:ribosomal protein L6P/L9E
MRKIERKQTVKIPNNIEIFYCKRKKIILFKGPVGNKLLKIHSLLGVYCTQQQITVINESKKKISNSEKKKIHTLKKTATSNIKQLLIETTAITYQKLKFVGVGYRAFPVENFEGRLILLRLGYSYSIYFKIMPKTNVFV